MADSRTMNVVKQGCQIKKVYFVQSVYVVVFFLLLSFPSFSLYLSLDHFSLPWDCSLWAVDIVLEEDSLVFAKSCFTCGCPHFIHLLHDRTISPETGNKAMIVALSVQRGILQSRISSPHDVMQNDRRCDEMLHFLWRQVQGRQETSEAVG